MRLPPARTCIAGMAALAAVSCSRAHELDDAAPPDARATGLDGGRDAAADAGRDAAIDAARDGGLDAARDAARDGGPDAPTPCGEPEIVGSVAVSGLAFGIAADRGFVHAVLTRTGVATIDATDPADMRVVAELPFDQPRGVVASGPLAVILAEVPGAFPVLPVLHGYDLPDPSRPTELFVDSTAVTFEAVLTGSELVVASGVDVVTMDATAFGAYRRGSVAVTPRGGDLHLARDGDRVALAGDRGLDVLDVSSFAAPRAVAHADLGDAARGVAISGDRVYVAASSVLEVYAIEGSALRLLASVRGGRAVQDVARWRDRLVVARYSDVVIVEEAMPQNEVAFFVPNPTALSSGGLAVAIEGDTAFVGGDGLVTAIALCPPP